MELFCKTTMNLFAARYGYDPSKDEDIAIHGNYLSTIPEPYLRPIIRALIRNGASLPNERYSSEECARAKPWIEGISMPPTGYYEPDSVRAQFSGYDILPVNPSDIIPAAEFNSKQTI